MQPQTYEQLKEVWGQHQTLWQAIGTAFEESTSRQEQLCQELLKQKEEMAAHSRELEVVTLRIQEQHELLRQASLVEGQQRTELKEVREAILSPRGMSRWGWLTGPSEPRHGRKANRKEWLPSWDEVDSQHPRCSRAARRRSGSLWTVASVTSG
jgi:hypothetical protein